MSQWKNIGWTVALSAAAAFAGIGCFAQGSAEEAGAQGQEETGEAQQLDELPWCGTGWPGHWHQPHLISRPATEPELVQQAAN